MRQAILFLIAAFTSVITFGQTSGQSEVIGSAGEELKSNRGSISFTIGEVVTMTLMDTTIKRSLTQGFHQTTILLTEVFENQPWKFDLSIWPNPTHRYLTISFQSDQVNAIEGQIYDQFGVVLHEMTIESKKEIDLETLPASSYYLRIYNPHSTEMKVYRIIKL